MKYRITAGGVIDLKPEIKEFEASSDEEAVKELIKMVKAQREGGNYHNNYHCQQYFSLVRIDQEEKTSRLTQIEPLKRPPGERQSYCSHLPLY